MKKLLIPVFLLTTASASAETIRLDCPTSVKEFAFFSHRWSLDLDAMQATLSSPQSGWLEPGIHSIAQVTDDSIFVTKDADERVFWEIDRYKLSSSIVYGESGRSYILSERCSISEKQF